MCRSKSNTVSHTLELHSCHTFHCVTNNSSEDGSIYMNANGVINNSSEDGSIYMNANGVINNSSEDGSIYMNANGKLVKRVV